ncbi:EamA family transporter [cyanobiont of Ornithocercus magnificus]|nr:EamA family transporter [cyanobiont of Ornithocercus magnificus]
MTYLWRWLLMLLPFALWGTAMTAMTPLVQSGSPILVAALRLLPAGTAVIIALLALGRPLSINRGDLPWFFVFTLVDGTVFQLFLARGLSDTGAGLGSILIDSQPLMVALLARALFGEAINPIGWIGLSLGLLGIVFLGVPLPLFRHLVLSTDESTLSIAWNSGELWMLAAAVAMAFGTVLIRYASRSSDPVAITGWHMLLGSLPLLTWYSLTAPRESLIPTWSVNEWLQMGYASLLGGALAYGLFFWLACSVELTSFSTLGFLTPVFALLSSGLLLGERLSAMQWLGAVLVLLSVVLVSQRRRLWEPPALIEVG